MYDCIVIGGGISGASFANRLRNKGRSVLILEAQNQLGGCIRTHRASSDFWMELGAHTCYNSYTQLIDLLRENNLDANLRPLSALPYSLYDKGQFKGFMGEISWLSLLANGWRYFITKRDGKTTSEYFRPIVGEGNYQRVFRRLFRAVISQEADGYPAEIFLKTRKEKYKKYARRLTYSGGLGQMIDDLAGRNTDSVRLGVQVASVCRTERGFSVETTDGHLFESKTVAVASGVNVSARLLAEVLPAVASELATISVVRTTAVGVAASGNTLTMKLVAGLVPMDDSFSSAVSHDVVGDGKGRRAFTFHFTDADASVEDRKTVICSVLGISDEKMGTTTCEHSLPAMRLRHLGLAEKLRPQLENSDVYLLGNFFNGMSLEDCVRRSLSEAERADNELSVKSVR